MRCPALQFLSLMVQGVIYAKRPSYYREIVLMLTFRTYSIIPDVPYSWAIIILKPRQCNGPRFRYRFPARYHLRYCPCSTNTIPERTQSLRTSNTNTWIWSNKNEIGADISRAYCSIRQILRSQLLLTVTNRNLKSDVCMCVLFNVQLAGIKLHDKQSLVQHYQRNSAKRHKNQRRESPILTTVKYNDWPL